MSITADELQGLAGKTIHAKRSAQAAVKRVKQPPKVFNHPHNGFWQKIMSEAPIAAPSFVLPPGRNPSCLCALGTPLGMKFITRPQPDGSTHVWRIK